MNHRILKVLICMAVVLGLVSHGLCAVLATHAPETPCQNIRFMNKVDAAGASGSCEMLPCHAKDRQPVLLPDALAGRFKTQDQQAPQSQGPAFILETLTLFYHPHGGAAVLKAPLALNPTPLFYLHCSMIC